MRGFMPWVRPLVIVIVVAVVAYISLDIADNVTHNCKPNGEQRLANSVDGVIVENKLICDGGRVKWSRY
ncbi:hypothetical protein KP12_81 [Klebsiella phage KP12]|jgi:hypothetical protein|uniref:Uncharacterized protein n=6 Tax=Vequintavirinae TaxID=1911928 RepID=A0A3G8F123_9CAUD|nr:hypothetical protein KB57_021 [Klebsiella phage vB_KpnM_KB57]YP_009832768.1 hypothetical protein BIS47_261 [Klebsiella phage vB_KpnM_BIS47]YP_009842459.1 hypothetical protein HWB97_gp194 [Proteus phage Mydo]YP_009859068.1 hypothetical protein HWD29_gp022 [Klebsiella phage KpS8]YP_009966124.1 membrane protein [Klebsiella phage KNP2]QKE60451.1 hypothetical protein KPP_1211 [Klebsiella phage KPP-1]QOI68599.1 hypothetical protein phage621_00022 [Klebsiella phage vB_KpnM_Seu621]UNI73491.1 hypo